MITYGRCTRAETTRDCRHNHHWADGRAYKLANHTDDQPVHTVGGKTSATGWPYGTTHDYDCPACVASGASFTTSPRSETYWSS